MKQLKSLLTNPNISVLGINKTKLVSIVKNRKVKIDGYNIIWFDLTEIERKDGLLAV